MTAAGSGLPRPVELLVAGSALVLLAPLLGVLGILTRLSSPGPALFRQVRAGRDGVPFTLLKLRTMRITTDATHSLTVGCDPRITAWGGWLREHKLDELPQLVNVVRGEMSLVGPRPEVMELVRWEDAEQRFVLQWRPGLTDPASLTYTHEAELLARQDDPERYYREIVLPDKLRLSAAYLRHRTAWTDLAVLLRTARHVLGLRRTRRAVAATG